MPSRPGRRALRRGALLARRPQPEPQRWLRIAVVGALFSVLMVGVMTGAAIVCANGACHGAADPAPARAVLELSEPPPVPEASVTPGRLPTADPAR